MDIGMHDLPNRPVNDIINGIEMYLQKPACILGFSEG